MDSELKAKWIAALRSGEYKQTRAVLRNDNGFCCLGVLCDVVDNSKWGAAMEGFNGKPRYPYQFQDRTDDTGLARKELVEFGLDKQFLNDSSTGYGTSKLETILMDMNDSEDKTFAEIADYLESIEF